MPARRIGPDGAGLRAQIVRLRSERLSWRQIAERVDRSVSRVHTLYSQALAEIPAQAVLEHRVEETELIDAAVRDLLSIATGQTGAPDRTRVEAWSAIRGWAERKARLLGLDAPPGRIILTESVIDAEIARLEAELAGKREDLAGG